MIVITSAIISKRLLEQCCFPGKLFMLTANSVNWCDTNNQLWALLDSKYDASPMAISILNLEMYDIARRCTIGGTVLLYDNALTFDNFTVPIAAASVFDPQIPHYAIVPTEACIEKVREYVKSKIVQDHNSDGFKPFFFNMGNFFDQESTLYSDLYLKRAMVGIREFVMGLQVENYDMAFTGASLIVGLGIGATPSGDDFLLGFMGAVYAFSIHFPKIDSVTTLFGSIAAHAKNATTKLSSTYLSFAAQGDFSQRFLDFIKSIISENRCAIEFTTERLLNTGHTSGYDIVLGALTGLEYLKRKCNV